MLKVKHMHKSFDKSTAFAQLWVCFLCLLLSDSSLLIK